MLKLIRVLDDEQSIPSGDRRRVVAECLRCGRQHTLKISSYWRHNRENRRCADCRADDAHHMCGTPFYDVWRHMRARCEYPKAKGYAHYGGRGIQVCERWQAFKNFYDDMFASYSEGMTIERIDVNGHYEPSNCRWATHLEQQANKRNNRVLVYQGEEMHLAELCRRSGVSKTMMLDRLSKGMTPDEAVMNARESTYGKSRWAQKYGKGRKSLTSSTAGRATGS